ncbi:hypothetical protein L5515_013589 [Caenorhabditis briggsae]|uniref:Uncharacterized protein n=1 Tax=Caenorhabditis briggsae TaxID=6238 RepID=A0AAE9E8N5_CAEBR|nr:hypothetical protein L5515_013589 [Caenorhabditis briggsae]
MQEHQTEVEKVQKQDKEFTARTIAIFQRINDADIIIVMFFMDEYVNINDKNVLVPNYKGESFVLNVHPKWHNPLGQVALIDWYRRLFDQRPKNGEIENDQVFEDLERLQRSGEESLKGTKMVKRIAGRAVDYLVILTTVALQWAYAIFRTKIMVNYAQRKSVRKSKEVPEDQTQQDRIRYLLNTMAPMDSVLNPPGQL